MMFRRLLTAVSLCLLTLVPHAPAVAATAKPSHVQASLVAADQSIQPGQPITVALRFVHDPHWHTYWINPGTGLATSLQWKLPPGWTAGPIQWPAPTVLKDSKRNVVGTGYEGELFLPVTLTPPADLKPGTTIELKADADWLMCEDVCIPGNATVALSLPVTADVPKPDPVSGEKIRATVAGLPRADAAWKVTASRTAKSVTLTVTPTAPGGHTPKDVHFFAEDGLVAYDLPQVVKPDGRGGFVLTLPVAADAPADAKKLIGVVTSENGWLAGTPLRGLSVMADFAPGSTAGAAATSAAQLSTLNPQLPPAAAGASLPGTLLLAFLGGLILNLMPCVFPVLGIKIMGFVNQAGHQRSKIVAHGLAFTIGVLISFWALAGALAILRAGGSQLGWGFQLQSAAFVYALAVLLLVFGMNMSGVFEFGLGATSAVSNAPWMQKPKSNYTESFLTGVLATAVATPCSAPFLAPALGAALAVSTAESFLIFTTIAIGLSTPYLLLSIFPQAVKVLPRPGAWMETFKQFMAFPLYATVGYLIWVLAAQTGEEGFRGVLFSLVLIAMAVWMYGRWNAPGASPGRARFGMISLIVVGAVGLWVGWPRDTSAPAPGAAAETAPKVVWEPWSPEAVAKLRAEGRTVYVDFTARWCATCQTNKKLVFGSDEVLTYFAANKIVALRADWTTKDPRITTELAAYQRSAVPFNLIWKPGADAPLVLPEILTPGTVLEALKKG
ncbi:protein-disulfide reductase DsbD family protein [Horticoccus sp. 23ND18S-11]|uniref:protein-disulfide reductase DsbD family protein n=1 Tax=Horticoccus sp. 23ND18S-11 TaxID=3391832 RepID=UPI0039C99809